MLSKTSYFNATLFRKNLTRFWPLWGMASFFGAIFPLALLVQVLQNYRFIADVVGLEMTQAYYAVVAYGVPIISLCYAILCAMCVWNYLYNARSVGFLHTLPIRREGLFVTNFLSGMVMMAIPYAITGILCVLVSVLAGGLDLKGILITILAVVGESFFYFSGATLVAFITSNIMALPVLYFIFQFLAVLLDLLISVFAQGFFFGYQGEFTGAVNFLSPTVFLMENIRPHNVYEEIPSDVVYNGVQEYTRVLTDVELENGWLILVYALVGVLLTAAAWLLYQRRRSESAGEVVAVGWMKPIFRYGVSFCGALAGGLLLYYMFWGMYQGGQYYDLLPLLVCMAVAGAIGYYLASMLLAKSLRVFKGSWKGLGLVAITVAIVCGIMHFDLLGVESRVPDADSVESVQVRINASNHLNVVVTEPEDIERVREAHRAVLAHRDTLIYRDANNYIATDASGKRLYYEYSYLRLNYTLKSGLTVERRYPVYYLPEEVDQPGTAVNALKELYSSDAIQYADLMGGIDKGRIVSGELSYPARAIKHEDGYISWEWDFKSLTSAQAEALVEAVRKDIAAGSFGRNAFDNERWQKETYAASLHIYYKTIENGEMMDWNDGLDLKFSVNSTHLVAELERQGILNRTQLYTEEQVYASDKYGNTAVVPESAIVYANPNSAPTVEEIISGAISEKESIGIIGGADGPTAVFVTGG
ncbi:MAG: hypothetical protein E7445_05455 [Ruminococcaceae bacterium]|nr:hypothetical protein [Oscillospiraceae bacterium]